jgi:hypothetical protein
MSSAHLRDRERDNIADRNVAKVSVEEYEEYGMELGLLKVLRR